jgi:hypothetical protein
MNVPAVVALDVPHVLAVTPHAMIIVQNSVKKYAKADVLGDVTQLARMVVTTCAVQILVLKVAIAIVAANVKKISALKAVVITVPENVSLGARVPATDVSKHVEPIMQDSSVILVMIVNVVQPLQQGVDLVAR